MKVKLHPDVRRLLDEISDYRARNNLDRTKFGILAANDGHLIPRLQSGRLPRLTTIDKVRAYMNSGRKR
jgi:hypothetical protein